jgi:RNA polymerase sigma-70 factor, ECF subfamily
MLANGTGSDLGNERPNPEARRSVAPRDDAQRFEILIQPLLSNAYGLAFSMLGNREEAEDAVQDAVAKAWRAFPRLRMSASSQAWLFTIVANQCRDARRRSRTVVLSLFDIPEPKVADHADTVARDVDLERALARLSPQQRGLLFLRYKMDMPPTEIATVLRWRIGTVKSRLHRTLRRLEAAVAVSVEEYQ